MTDDGSEEQKERGGATDSAGSAKEANRTSEEEPAWDLPPVFHRFYVFCGWLLDRIGKFPKDARFTFGQQMTDEALGILARIVRAAYGRRRAEQLEAANTELEVLRVFLRLAKDRRYISRSQYKYAVGELLEVGRMVGGWLKSCR